MTQPTVNSVRKAVSEAAGRAEKVRQAARDAADAIAAARDAERAQVTDLQAGSGVATQ